MKSPKPIPPGLATRFLLWFLRAELAEEVLGDLEEKFYAVADDRSVGWARLNYWYQVLNYFRPFAIRKTGAVQLIHFAMIRNTYKIAIRNMLKQRAYSGLNILGLGLGIACVLLIVIHVKHELSYESTFPKHSRIYRVSYEGWAKSAPLMAQTLEEEIPEIRQTTRFFYMGSGVFQYEDFQAEESHGYMVDSTVFSVFDLELVQGDAKRAFRAPYDMVITQRLATKYFGHENPIGKTLKNRGQDFHITGVMRDLPENTHFQISYLVSMATFEQEVSEDWRNSRGWMAGYTYVLLNAANEIEEVEAKLPDLLVKYYEGWGTEAEILADQNWTFMPISDIHLYSDLIQEMGPNSDVTYVYIFAAIGLLILLIAAINFINIFTTQSLKRMKEVGVRRIIGAGKNELFWQFLGEAFIVTSIASIVAVILFEVGLPFYNDLAGKTLSSFEIFRSENLLMVAAIVWGVGLISGLFPAMFVSGFSPLDAIKGIKKPHSSANFLRKGLLVVQFAVAVFMLISTVVVFRQMQYFYQKDLGFDTEQVVAVRLNGELKRKFVANPAAIKSELMQHPDIISIGATSNSPGEGLSVESLVPDGVGEEEDYPIVQVMRIDDSYISTLQIDLQAGRNFSREFNDSAAFLINEAAARLLEVGEHDFLTNRTRDVRGKVVGVLKDFHFSSLHSSIEPLVLEYRPGWADYLFVKVSGGDLPKTLSGLEASIHEMVPDYLFTYQFLDERIASLYEDESRLSTLFQFFALFAIIMACLGLFGLSAHAAEVRTKEIAIRKTIGANVRQIVRLLSANFVRLVLIGNLIAWPVSWWAMDRWLENFVYHVSIHWSVFLFAGMLSLLVALMTISYHAIRTALANPVDALRSE